jgi:protease-4
MTQKERSVFVRFFSTLWQIIDGTRKAILNAVFFLMLLFVILIFFSTEDSLIVHPETTLVINPYGNVVEQLSGTPLDQALQNATEQTRRETRLRDLVEAIRRSRDDDRIVQLVIDPKYMWRIGLASLLELEAVIADFKTSGKPVIALADNLGQQQYFLTAMADEIWLQPQGMVWIDGFSAYRNFYREGLEKLEVEINLFRVGKYKSAMEPYIRDDMSAQAREANLYWITSLWQQYLEGISRQRGIPLLDLSTAINQFADRLDAVDGDFARFAMELGLVDRLLTRPEANQELAARGAIDSGHDGYRKVDFDNYLMLTDLQHRPRSQNKVVVIVAEGEILRGHQPPGVIGSETLIKRLRAIGRNSKVKAVVVRLNSPGGETFASEKIRREVQALKENGKTVVISMGDVAASGAYWIAMAGEEVWASPSSITGSIGVYGMIPTIASPLEKLGIHTDGVGSTPLAGRLRADMPLADDLKRIFQRSTENTYGEFIELVAENRNMSTEMVEEVARGRVWSGAQAKERGLVDQNGTLQQAIDSAARIAGLGSDYDVKYSELELSTFETFLMEFAGGTAARLGFGSEPTPWARVSLLEDILSDMRMLANTANGFSLAAHCLCKSP